MDGRRGTEKVEGLRVAQEVAVGGSAGIRQFRSNFVDAISRFGLVLLPEGNAGDPSQQDLEVIGGSDPIRGFLRNGFTLLGQPDVPPDRLVGQRLQKSMRRSGAPAHVST